jgi:hypothetical protein
VHTVAPPDPSAQIAPLAALDRAHERLDEMGTGRKILLSTADAGRLIPFVLVASHSFLASHVRELAEWSEAWLQGEEALRRDPAAAARMIAALPGAPDAVGLLETLGLEEPAGVAENAELAGPVGRETLTIDEIFRRTWGLWRSAGVVNMPSPSAVPFDSAVLQRLAGAVAPQATPTPVPPPPRDARVLLIQRLTSRDDRAIEAEIGFDAQVFERSPLRIEMRTEPKKLKTIVAEASERFGLAPGRVTLNLQVLPPPKWVATIEILAAP